MPFVEPFDHCNDQQDGNSADKYSICEKCEVTIGEPQDDLAEVAAIGREKATYLATAKARALEEVLREQASESESRGSAQTIRHLTSCFSYEPNGLFIITAQIDSSFHYVVPIT